MLQFLFLTYQSLFVHFEAVNNNNNNNKFPNEELDNTFELPKRGQPIYKGQDTCMVLICPLYGGSFHCR